MREILFRGKRLTDGEWVEGQLLISHTGCHWIVTLYDEILGIIEKYRVDEKTVGQYTGLTDRNGEKIFEGDICKYGYDDEYTGEWFYDVFDFSITGIDDENVFNLLVFDKKKEEWFFQGIVVGNVHDNPKLLEQLQEEK